MYAEVVKVDGKGRITIPSYVRLLLNVDEGSKVLMSVDEVRGTITLRVFQKGWVRCFDTLNRDELAELILKATVISFKCTSNAPNGESYECDMVIDSGSSHRDILKRINCFNE